MKPGAGQGSPLRVAPLYRAILVKIITCLWPSCPTSRAPNHRLRLQDARAVRCSLGPHAIPRGLAGVGAVCRAVPRGQAGVGVGRQRHQGDIEAALAVRRRRWAAWRGGAWTSSCDHAATSSAVLCRSFVVVPQLQFIDSGRCARWRASCASLCCAQRQVPTVLLFLQGSGCCSTLTRLSMSGLVALWRLVKEFLIFSTCSRCLLGIWTLFLRAPCSGSHLPLCVATVHGSCWANFVYFLREKWTPTSPRSSHLGNLNIIYTSSHMAVGGGFRRL